MPASGVTGSPEDFIRRALVLAPLPFRTDISLYQPGPQSGLVAFLAEQGRAEMPPYWAYAWAGGAALALYLRDHPDVVRDKKVLDFGAGSGLVGIAAAMAGATEVLAFEPDPIGGVALTLNAEANGVRIALGEANVEVDIALAGDVFYEPEVAATVLPALQAVMARGGSVLIGDPFRRDLPLAVLDEIARYDVPDMGSSALVRAGVFALRP